jgi:hypothetical protein
VDVVARGEGRSQQRVLLVLRAVVVHRQERGASRPTTGGALAAVCIAGELPRGREPSDRFHFWRSASERKTGGGRRRVSVAQPTASADSHGEVTDSRWSERGAGSGEISRWRRWRKTAERRPRRR